MTKHRQVPCLDFTCDEELAELLALMNKSGVATFLSCQDNNGGRGQVRRIWVEIDAFDLDEFLRILDRPGEVADLESLSHRMAPEYLPDDWEAFEEDRAWHYDTNVNRIEGALMPPGISIRFPYTDLPEIVRRLREGR